MSRYSPAQIQEKAKSFLEAHDSGDERSVFLLIMLSHATGIDAATCIEKIKLLAEGGAA